MPQYMLLVHLPAGEEPPRELRDDPRDRWGEYGRALQEAGVRRGGARLAGPEVATTVRVRGDETQIIDGPFAETKEFFASFVLIETPDLATALDWAARSPVAAYGSVEVRPVRAEPEV